VENKKEQLSFENLAELKGYSPKKARNMRIPYVTHILKGKGRGGKSVEIKVDLKKIKNKKQSQDWLWVEFQNAEGKPGWIYGQADFVVFERTKDFIFVNRKELLDWCSGSQKIRYDLPFVTLAKKAKYRIYKREGMKEEITQILVDDIKTLKSFRTWDK
jgi:hypothetical protein